MAGPFVLDPAIEASSAPLATLVLCEARLQLDARYPWIVLIPRKPGLREIDELTREERALLMEEVVAAGKAVRAVGHAVGRSVEKLNIAALGNIVAQLHVHVVGRSSGDALWPGPVWGRGEAQPWSPQALAQALDAARRSLSSPGRPPGS